MEIRKHQSTNAVRRQSGFTLLELLIVIAIIIVIVVISVPYLNNVLTRYEVDNAASRVVGLAGVARERAINNFSRTEMYCSSTNRNCKVKMRPLGCSGYVSGNVNTTCSSTASSTASNNGDFPLVVTLSDRVKFVTPSTAANGAGDAATATYATPNTQATLGMLQCYGAVFNSRGYAIYDATATDVSSACLAAPASAVSDGASKNNYVVYLGNDKISYYVAIVIDAGGRATIWRFANESKTWYKAAY